LRAQEMSRRHLEVAERLGDVEILVFAHRVILIGALFSGDLNETVRLSREWKARFEATPREHRHSTCR
ncbi:MAG TPA: hypothetical protein VMB26_04300, partial [Candidatus Binataceae bacterium]|nr:hypothetical protein [Candidatus Binataceae bacterium]